jgi:hypothetical protein
MLKHEFKKQTAVEPRFGRSMDEVQVFVPQIPPSVDKFSFFKELSGWVAKPGNLEHDTGLSVNIDSTDQYGVKTREERVTVTCSETHARKIQAAFPEIYAMVPSNPQKINMRANSQPVARALRSV